MRRRNLRFSRKPASSFFSFVADLAPYFGRRRWLEKGEIYEIQNCSLSLERIFAVDGCEPSNLGLCPLTR